MSRRLNSDAKLVLSLALLVAFLAWLAVMFGIYEADQGMYRQHVVKTSTKDQK